MYDCYFKKDEDVVGKKYWCTYYMTVSNDLSAHTSTDDHITQIDSSGKS